MAQSATGQKRRPVVFGTSPMSRLWIAACLGFAGAFLGMATFLGLGEVFFSVKRLVLEAIFLSAP